MKKILALLLALMMVLSLAACDLGGNNDNPGGNTDNPGVSQTDNQGGESTGGEENNGGNETPEMTDEELAKEAFAQFGVDIADVLADFDGEVCYEGGISLYSELQTPLGRNARAYWGKRLSAPMTDAEAESYIVGLLHMLEEISEDGKVHGVYSEGNFEFIKAENDWAGKWGYVYEGVYVKVYVYARDSMIDVSLEFDGEV